MEPSRHLLNQRGQILIETLIVSLLISFILVVFNQLIELQKNQFEPYRFSKFKKEATHE